MSVQHQGMRGYLVLFCSLIGIAFADAAPTLSSISPNPVTGSSSPRTFTLTGSGFVSGTKVQVAFASNGYSFVNTSTNATFVSSTQLTVPITTSTTADTWKVRVQNPDATLSGQINLVVNAPASTPAPSLNSISPNPVTGSSSARTFTLTGSNFVSGAKVQVAYASNGYSFVNTSTNATFVSSTELTVPITTSTTADTWKVRVQNPDAQLSGQINLVVNAPASTPAPTLNSISPNPVTGSSSPQTFTLAGSNFVSGAKVQVAYASNGYSFVNTSTNATFVSSTQLTVPITTSTTADTWKVRVQNPDAQSSGQINLVVNAPASAPAPTLNSISPNPVTGSSSAQTFTLTGSNFVSGAKVQVAYASNGYSFVNTSTNATFVSSTQLTVPITTSTTADTWKVRVQNPDAQVSGQVNLVVNAPSSAPAPGLSSITPNPVTGSTSAQTFTLSGSNFVNGAKVQVAYAGNGYTFVNTNTNATFVSSTTLTVPITTQLQADTWKVRVQNPDSQLSGQIDLVVNAPSSSAPPTLNSINPNPVTGSTSAQTFTLSGSNFVNGAKVQVAYAGNGYTFVNTNTNATFISSTTLTVPITTQLQADTWKVRVQNPDSQLSGQIDLVVNAPASSTPPTLNNINPNPVTGSTSAQTFTLSGSDFVSGVKVQVAYAGNGYTFVNTNTNATFVSSTTLTVPITTQLQSDTWKVRVQNPDSQLSGQIDLVVNAPSTSPTPVPGVTPTPTPSASPTSTPTPSPSVSVVTVSMFRVASNAIANADAGWGNINEPLDLIPSLSILAQQIRINGGLVADGVSPLLFKISGSSLNNATTLQIAFTTTGGQVKSGDLTQFLKVYQTSTNSFVRGSTINLSSVQPITYAYLTGIDVDDLQFNAGTNAVSVTLTIQGNGATSTLSFQIRKPPIVLVHGFHSDNGTWSSSFLQQFQAAKGNDFVVPVEYGVRHNSDGSVDTTTNTNGSFVSLASLLETNLAPALTAWKQNWAVTRYDAVGHSQGGVLLRMLCTTKQGFVQPFRSASNAFRGRFHRVITIGSPHQGTTLTHYALQLVAGGTPYSVLPAALVISGTLQPKFDPFKNELKEINGAQWEVDPGARFHLIGTSILGGGPPPLVLTDVTQSVSLPLVYTLTGLCARPSLFSIASRGETVLPSGSDGVVDHGSQFANGNTLSTDMSVKLAIDIAHSPPEAFFGAGVAKGSVDTQYAPVAFEAAKLLDSTVRVFSSFDLKPLDGTLEARIDAVVPTSAAFRLIQQIFGGNADASAGLATRTYYFQLVPDAGHPIASTPVWSAEISGPNGITTEGVTVAPTSSDGTQVVVTVDDGVIGDVSLYGSYSSSDGTFVAGFPVLVTSKPATPSQIGIEVRPQNITLTAGTRVPLEIWGRFDDGSASQLFVPADAPVSFSTSDSNIAEIDSNRVVLLKNPGAATITASYLGFSSVTNVQVAPVPFARPTVMGNIATRLTVGNGDSAMIGGFIITGTQPKTVIVRGIGPSLGPLGVPNPLGDPIIELHDSSGALVPNAINDNWRDATTMQQIIDSGLAPTNDLESALWGAINPGAYTVLVRGNGGTTGNGVFEVYDLDQAADSRLANVSTRGFVDTGDNVMIAGTIVVGNTSASVLIRAIGPSLVGAGVPNALQDPALELHDHQGNVIATNDNWRDSQEAEIIETTISPTDDRESAILRTLAPGAYTAVVRGNGETTGVAVVEAYQLQ